MGEAVLLLQVPLLDITSVRVGRRKVHYLATIVPARAPLAATHDGAVMREGRRVRLKRHKAASGIEVAHLGELLLLMLHRRLMLAQFLLKVQTVTDLTIGLFQGD